MSKRRFINQLPQSERRAKAYKAIVAGVKEAGTCRYNDLFEAIWPKLKGIYEATGEEMMRLSTYEHLQNLVTRGDITKNGKDYSVSEQGEKFLANDGEEASSE